MLAQRQSDVAVILHDVVPLRHLAQFDLGFLLLEDDRGFAFGGGREQRKRFVAQGLYRPERVASLQFQGRQKGVCLGELHQRLRRNVGSPPDVVNALEFLVHARGDDPCGVGDGQTFDHPHAQADGMSLGVADALERAVPTRPVDADWTDFDAVLGRVSDDLCGRIETHRLRVQQGRAEDVGMVAFNEVGRAGDKRETRGV
jgi:hypothetical protein